MASVQLCYAAIARMPLNYRGELIDLSVEQDDKGDEGEMWAMGMMGIMMEQQHQAEWVGST